MRADLEGADLEGADLEEADLHEANLVHANLRQATGLKVEQVQAAKNWKQAVYDADFRAKLGISQEDADKVRKKLGLPTEAEEEAQKKGEKEDTEKKSAAEKKSPDKKPDK